MGSPESQASHPGTGSIYIFTGAPSGMGRTGEIRPAASASRHGDEFGATVAVGRFGAGQQVVVGAPGRGPDAFSSSGFARWEPRLPSTIGLISAKTNWPTPADGDRFGSVLAVADFDGDGLDDIAAGVPDKVLHRVSDGWLRPVVSRRGRFRRSVATVPAANVLPARACWRSFWRVVGQRQLRPSLRYADGTRHGLAWQVRRGRRLLRRPRPERHGSVPLKPGQSRYRRDTASTPCRLGFGFLDVLYARVDELEIDTVTGAARQLDWE